ncbi:PfkB family carbohydrate kinase [uncultured Roseobacter sp.]|uniref:PfkB family carbohydrate kinase n=1 Tax=uncultured Roseobacter sp. TaxID=114847 RepID=UPI002637A5CF|nr:PfkB family carbohydrate kinase [uncultured Roseobacter sp.]
MHEWDDSLRRAYVFGNVAVDEVFQMRALPANGQSVLAQSNSMALGGKGANQAIALARTGVQTTLVTAIGADRNGELIERALAEEPLECTAMSRASTASDRSIILADEAGDNAVVTTNACAESLTLAECLPVLEQAREGDAVLVQGNLRPDLTLDLCKEAHRRKLWTIVNPSPFDDVFREILPLTDVLFLNEAEALELTKLSKDAATSALLSAGAAQVVLTLGPKGAIMATKTHILHVPAAPSLAVDPTGAGDIFEGVAVGSAILRGSGLDEAALIHGSFAAAVTVGRIGAVSAFPSVQDIAELIRDNSAVSDA